MYDENMNVYSNIRGAPSFDPFECFGLYFLEGTHIRVCYGCSNPIRTDTSVVPPPPHNVVMAYKERRWYWDLHAQLMKLIATAENKCYQVLHKKVCLNEKPKFHNTLCMLHIPPDILAKLTVHHKIQMYDKFTMEV